jgi:hypothetical protein
MLRWVMDVVVAVGADYKCFPLPGHHSFHPFRLLSSPFLMEVFHSVDMMDFTVLI